MSCGQSQLTPLFACFNRMGTYISKFEVRLKEHIVNAFRAAGCAEATRFDQSQSLSGLLDQCSVFAYQHQLVFLIDDWDKPLSNRLDNESEFNVVKDLLAVFYSWLRSLPNLRFVLVTGIMRYRETSWFTGQDIQDLSMDPDFADLLGYTQEEIKQAFAQYIPLAAERMHITQEQLLEQLKLYYAGFCFDYDASVEVYCPLAINKFFSAVKSKNKVPYFESYWMRSANDPSALLSYLLEHTLKQAELKELYEQQFTLSYAELTEANYCGAVKFKQLLVQAGYFSIKSIAGIELDDDEPDYPEHRRFNCAITNKDVEKGFVPVLTQYLRSLSLLLDDGGRQVVD